MTLLATWASTRPTAASANKPHRTCPSWNAASSPAMAAAVIVIGSTDARVITSQRDKASTRPAGGLLVRNAYRQLARSRDRVAMPDFVSGSLTSVTHTLPFRSERTRAFGFASRLVWQTPGALLGRNARNEGAPLMSTTPPAPPPGPPPSPPPGPPSASPPAGASGAAPSKNGGGGNLWLILFIVDRKSTRL